MDQVGTNQYPALAGNRMYSTKNERKQAECDVQLLANRLNHLQMEESRAIKKIDETKKRANEIMSLKQRDEASFRSKQENRQQEEMLLQSVVQKNALAKAQRTQSLKERQYAVYAQKKQDAELMRMMSQERNIARDEERESFFQQRQKIAASVRNQESAAMQRREMQKQNQEQHLMMEYDQQRLQELATKEEYERTVAELEKAEEHSIAKLKIAQEQQVSAYLQLREACLAGTEDEEATM